ncbi:MAG: DNA-directed RNA polymerase subunit alpha [Parcubacteria group bacterium GW2011_GWA1_50_14]|uniref:DNA-directed RNA polymerase subunit alpha n=2 Tax=Candidatus Colwelliibacteriota TaxID=1817904 RepID=A0A1G1ZFB9_9BACT|nr:MAG: DNA-directed RNA polymerase subunit alpha [Parcubacteria group bacterium GW2011_GWA1_50_14]OGY57432.1 MAG: DNA-directed RNA polymerase subunit alpha [Candidatus Colwellbacteria bacterium RIFCSPHIGHO2_02_FULL_45_17]OGY61050.1 MAG: DNA-directed RNA polymerase subunit alpha [Candidatus Colwellbacteria bacterium RIFCSPLOWO2_02_FULL_45_11]OGY62537.1 MAG: DNA-directed RNA polymerase subunit alpha [Candidatus Colwellbacteria bacterium RIFCSPLOWO2_12_FULL_46_17]
MEYKYLSDSVRIKRIEENDTLGSFSIEGLYRGYGITVGNALRRALLSSLPGAAITRFKIKGVGHEFTTVPGVTEDVVELSLNLKKVRFAFYADEPQTLILKVKGDKDVTAKDIKGNAQVEIKNDVHIATLSSKNAELDMELVVEKGLGYQPVEAQKIGRLPIGTIALDAVFSPVVNVNFSVENMRVGERTDYNKVRLEIETDGTISPSSALHKASSVLLDHFGKISEIDVKETKLSKSATDGAESAGKTTAKKVTAKKTTTKSAKGGK